MLIFNDIYHWKGWGGKLGLASGSCNLRIFDLKEDKPGDLLLLRPTIVIVSDVPGNKMSVRSCAGHIATMVTRDFAIKPHRMMWVEYYPSREYGREKVRIIPEKYDAVEFLWKGDKAIEPKWRSLNPPMLEQVMALMNSVPPMP